MSNYTGANAKAFYLFRATRKRAALGGAARDSVGVSQWSRHGVGAGTENNIALMRTMAFLVPSDTTSFIVNKK
jgi:hypothetical protein